MNIFKNKQKLKTRASLLFFVTILMWLFSVSVSADYFNTTYNNLIQNSRMSQRLTSGCNNIPYYLSTSVDFNNYRTNANTAVLSWNNSSNGISFSSTSNYATSVIDISSYNNSHPNAAYRQYEAITVIWMGGGPYATNNVSYYGDYTAFPKKDFWAAECLLNRSEIAASETDKVKGTIAHEVGHGLGLGHRAAPSIMTVTYSSTTLTPVTNDFVRVHALYNLRASNGTW